MDETQRMLERAGERFDMPEPAMDRMLRRRERRQRNARIVAAAVGLGVFAAGVAGAVLTLRVTGGNTAASGGGHAAASEGGGLVLPTVAIWTAIVVLALTAFAAARLRARFGHADVDLVREEEGPNEAATSVRPAPASAGAPWKGGTEMDSEPRMQVGIPRAEMPAITFDDGKLRRTNRWLTGAVAVLAVAVVALGVALIAQTGSGQTASPGTTPSTQWTPPDPAARLIDRLDAAVSRRDGAAAAALFTPDGFIQAGNGVTVFQGRAAIAHRISHLPAFTAERIGSPLEYGPLAVAIYEISYPSGSESSVARTFVIRGSRIYSVTDVQYETRPA